MLLDKVSLGATRTPLRAGGGGAKAGVGAAELLASGMTVPSSCCPQPRQPQLRVERALAHAARRSKGLRPAARLSARRQRAALHSPPTLILPPQHDTRGRIAICCRGRAIRSCGSSARSRSRTRPGALRVCGSQLASLPDDSAPPCTAPYPFMGPRRSTAREAEARSIETLQRLRFTSTAPTFMSQRHDVVVSGPHS